MTFLSAPYFFAAVAVSCAASAQTMGLPPKGPAGPDHLSRSFSAPNANAADVSVQVIREPTGPIYVNDTLRYRIIVANAGPAQARYGAGRAAPSVA